MRNEACEALWPIRYQRGSQPLWDTGQLYFFLSLNFLLYNLNIVVGIIDSVLSITTCYIEGVLRIWTPIELHFVGRYQRTLHYHHIDFPEHSIALYHQLKAVKH